MAPETAPRVVVTSGKALRMARRSDTPPVPTQSLESQHRDIPLKHGILPFLAGVLMGFCLAAMWLDHLDHQAFLQASTAAKPAE